MLLQPSTLTINFSLSRMADMTGSTNLINSRSILKVRETYPLYILSVVDDSVKPSDVPNIFYDALCYPSYNKNTSP